MGRRAVIPPRDGTSNGQAVGEDTKVRPVAPSLCPGSPRTGPCFLSISCVSGLPPSDRGWRGQLSWRQRSSLAEAEVSSLWVCPVGVQTPLNAFTLFSQAAPREP